MKKLFSLMLALLMLCLPVLSTAEGTLGLIGGADGPTEIILMPAISRYQAALDAGRRVNRTLSLTELTGVNTGDEMTDAAIADLVTALGANFSAQGDEMNLALTLSGAELLTLGGALSGADVYLSSNLLGGTMVVGKDEVEPLLNRLVDTLVLMQAMTEEVAGELKAQIAELKVSFEEFSAEEAFEDQLIAELDISALEAILPMLLEKINQTEDIIMPRMCDSAVSGLQMVLTNADFHAVLKQGYQLYLDNPMLLEYLSATTGVPTEAQLEEQWAAGGQLFMALGIYENKEAFLAAQESVEGNIRAGVDLLENIEIFGGDAVVNAYLDEQDQPVYITATLPILVEDVLSSNPEAPMMTEVVNLTYTRQTVPQGVAHVCNIFAGEIGLTIDALVSESSTTVTVTAVEPEFEPAKLFDLSIKEAASEINPGVTCIDVDAVLYGAEEPTLEIAYDGEYETSDVREYCAGKLTMTAYQRYVDYFGEETTISTYADTLTLEFNTDTAINGIDYTTDASFTVEAGVVRFGLKMTEATADPEPSIMTGNVVRPAELNDADFSTWFSGVMTTLELWASDAMFAMPESVLTLMLYSGV